MSKKAGIKMSFADLAAQWLASIEQGIKESTLAHYYYTLQRYLLPLNDKSQWHILHKKKQSWQVLLLQLQ